MKKNLKKLFSSILCISLCLAFLSVTAFAMGPSATDTPDAQPQNNSSEPAKDPAAPNEAPTPPTTLSEPPAPPAALSEPPAPPAALSEAPAPPATPSEAPAQPATPSEAPAPPATPSEAPVIPEPAAAVGVPDITTDLSIVTAEISRSTPTSNGTYSTGSPAGTYVPGKDYSATDDVSTNGSITHKISVSLSSLGGLPNYAVDKLYILSTDDPAATENSSDTPVYLINSSADPQNITDDNANTHTIGGATIQGVSYGPTENITTGSTISFDVVTTLPSPIYWKTKIMPKLQIVVEKDGKQTKSAPFALSAVRLSSGATLGASIDAQQYLWDNIAYTTKNNVKGFELPFVVHYTQGPLANVAPLGDKTKMDNVTFSVNLAPKLNGAPINLSTADITVSSTGVTSTPFALNSYSITNNVLTLNITPGMNHTHNINILVSAFVPYTNTTGATTANVALTGAWTSNSTGGVTYANFVNSYLFTKSITGSFNYTKDVSLLPPIVDPLVITDMVAANLVNNMAIVDTLTLTAVPFYTNSVGTKLTAIVDSTMASFKDEGTLQLTYTTTGGVSKVLDVPASAYTVQYAYEDTSPASFDPNVTGRNANNGTTALTSFASVIASGHKPNIRTVTLNSNILAGIDYNPNRAIMYKFINSHFDIISGADFQNVFNSTPAPTYYNKLFNYNTIITNYTAVATAQAENAGRMSAVDSFTSAGANVALNLGTNKTGSILVQRFNGQSSVRVDMNIGPYVQALRHGIYDNNDTEISSVSNYNATYYFKMTANTPQANNAVWSTFAAGTVFTFDVPTALRPYIYIANTPSMKGIDVATSSAVTTPITNFSYDGAKITVTIPAALNIAGGGHAYGITIPVKFFAPHSSIPATFANPQFLSSKVTLLSGNSFITGTPAAIPANTPFFKITQSTFPTTLTPFNGDTTFHTVSPPTYAIGSNVTFTTNVKNVLYPTGSDYLIAMSVPTNAYNISQNSDNTKDAFINGITAFNANTAVYFQTKTNATAADIAAVNTVAPTGAPTLKDYFPTIQTNWQKYTAGMTLPADVIMLVAQHPALALNDSVRVDYSTKVVLDPLDTTIYNNTSKTKYYSSVPNIEASGNSVSIANIPYDIGIKLSKAPDTQTKYKYVGERVSFSLNATLPQNIAGYTNVKLIDTLPACLTLDEASAKLNIVAAGGATTPTPFTLSAVGQKFTVDVTNFAALANKNISFTFDATVNSLSAIPASNSISNTYTLKLNNDDKLLVTSNSVEVKFTELPPYTPPVKSCDKTSVFKEIGEPATFTTKYMIPTETKDYAHSKLVVTDNIPAGLDVTASRIEIPTNTIATVTNQSVGNAVKYTIDFAIPAGDIGKALNISDFSLIIATQVSDLSKLGNTIENTASVKSDIRGIINSNKVTVDLTIPTGMVTIHYFDKATGAELVTADVLRDNVGVPYDATQSRAGYTFHGYTYVSADGDPEIGTFAKTPLVVNYYYQKDVAPTGTVKVHYFDKDTGAE
ncbi:MAG: isopeptide-forming domain-containing fimbrial protein, partial [Christensenella sp.]